MVVGTHEYFMHLALEEAWKYQGKTYPNPAVGCAVVSKEGALLALEAHQKAGAPHAEVNALKSAYLKLTNDTTISTLQSSAETHSFLRLHHKNIFSSVRLYTTLEPCSHYGKTPSCASLIAALGIKEVYVGSLDTNPLASAGNALLQEAGVETQSALLADDCRDLIEPFILWQEEQFVFFKWAQRLNATVEAGNVSSLQSRESVHAMRAVCDLLIIGGNTVRVDRPTLDARLVGGDAPDVLILSREKEFDTSIPLFHVKGRKVFVESDLSRVKEYKNIMIEGGQKMFELTRDIVDFYLCFVAPKFGGSQGFTNIEDNFKILNLQKESEDIIMWMKRVEGER